MRQSRTLPASQRALPMVWPALRDLELGQLLDVVVDDGGEAAQQPGPLARAPRPPGREGLVGALDGRVGLGQVGEGTSVTGVAVAGLTTVKVSVMRVLQVGGQGQSLSKPRRSSQSVTAASKAASSTSAMLT